MDSRYRLKHKNCFSWFYLLIFYFEKFSPWTSRLPFVVKVTLNPSYNCLTLFSLLCIPFFLYRSGDSTNKSQGKSRNYVTRFLGYWNTLSFFYKWCNQWGLKIKWKQGLWNGSKIVIHFLAHKTSFVGYIRSYNYMSLRTEDNQKVARVLSAFKFYVTKWE